MTPTPTAGPGNLGGGTPSGRTDDEVQSLKRALQDQRRKATLLNADVQRQIEARESVEAQLIEVRAELEASRDRRKEMARVITNRDARIAQLNAELQARYQELASLQRYVVRWTLSGWVRASYRRVKRFARKYLG